MSPTSPAHLSAGTLEGLRRLREASDRAAELGQGPEQWAVEVRELTAAGLTHADLRALVARGWAELLEECTAPGDPRRRFRPARNLSFTEKSCLVLTPAGAAAGPAAGDRPCWDAGRRELWFRGRLVKRYLRPAPSQEAILAAFEEEGWPPHIDDPLPSRPGEDPADRLHEAVRGLNRAQARALLHFRCDGHGQGVVWEPRR